jgi:O-antigen ligase
MDAVARPDGRLAFWSAALLTDLILLALLPKVPWVAAALAGLLAAAFLLARAETLLALLFLGMPLLAPLHLRDAGLTLALLGGRALFLGAWWIALRGRPRLGALRALADPAALCVLGLTALLALGLARSPAPIYGAGKTKSYLIANLFLFLAPLLLWPRWKRAGSLDRFLRAAVVIGALFAAVGLAAALGAAGPFAVRLGVPATASGAPARLAWLGTDPIWTARLLAIWLVLLLWGATRRIVRPALAVLLGAAGVYLMLRTGSRGPLLALLASPLALLFLPGAPGALRRAARIALPAAVVLAVALVLLLPAGERERLAATLLRAPIGSEAGERGPLLQDPSFAFRAEMARRGMSALVEGLPWGWGTGAFPAVLFLRDFRLYPHNLEVEIAFEQGLPGLALLLGFLLFTLAHARSLARRGGDAPWLFALAFMALVNAQVSGDITGNGELWFWAGMIGARHAASAPGARRGLA